MVDYSDDELLYLMRCGNEYALETLYQRYYNEVRQLIYPYCKNNTIKMGLDDYLQCAMLDFHKILDSYRDDKNASIKTFIKKALRKRVLNYIRDKESEAYFKSLKKVYLDQGVSQEDKIRFEELVGDPKYDYQPETRLYIKETYEEYIDHAKKVTSKVEYQVMQYIRLGYSQKEIAQMMGVPIKSVYNAIYRYHQKCNH